MTPRTHAELPSTDAWIAAGGHVDHVVWSTADLRAEHGFSEVEARDYIRFCHEGEGS